ncbi:TRAP transporter permease [Lutibaculum baratangense]|uniref:TRAP-type uncharacterized transport system, fused permease component n=1 Tax=Lutibaculum baratangense AMV1 TaxID=631454 RepID=V4RSX7_9HYPH|nr:TRAP transporter permease [Lutibaculum baratangense]ESR26235.1 TRAP-type uncharacterized transport system, fused permease component [Lutibaculum baratangense AMV1]
MSNTEREGRAGGDADEFATSDVGARAPSSRTVALVVAGTALLWSLFQLWVASPLPFMVSRYVRVLNDTEVRSIHLAFALFLAFLAFPAFRSSPRRHIPLVDWVLAITAAFCAGYIFLFYSELSRRPGLPTTLDLVVAGAGLVLLLEGARRSLGPAMPIVGVVFLSYVFFGSAAWVPDVLQWGGASFRRAMSHMWLTTEGVFGVALGVSASFVFLFVLFGALLERAGAGNYFIQVAFSLLGHFRGGPAKAAVLSSGLTGLISGSSIANVVTTGTFTIPLMKRVGYPGEKAGAVEVAASVNGQIMPPVMGAAAFLMVEYVGIPYVEVLRHALLPALITYIALIYIVHLEALKAGMTGIERPPSEHSKRMRFLRGAIVFLSILIVAAVTYYLVLGIQSVFGPQSREVLIALILVAYLVLLWDASKRPDLEMDDPESVVTLRAPGMVARTGLYFLLPIIVLVWCLIIEHYSPATSAFYATVLMIFIVVTQRPILALFRRQRAVTAEMWRGFDDLVQGLITGARNMIGIGVATAAAGIVVGTVTLTGVGQVMAQFVEFLSGGHVLIMLILVAIISLILGMGLPTTANYIVVSSLMAPVVVEVGAQSGLIVPLIAVHLFVFYFGIMADVTPPVGLASFAAAAISRADPIRTGVQAFIYESRTAILPFMFIFNTKLLLIGIEGPLDLFLTCATALTASLLIAAAAQRWFITKCRVWESLALLLIAFTFFRPGFWIDQIWPPLVNLEPARVIEDAGEEPADARLRVIITGPDFMTGRQRELTVMVPLGEEGEGEERLARPGLAPVVEGDQVILEEPMPGTTMFQRLQDFDFYADEPVRIAALQVENDQPPRELPWIPALLLLALIVVLQRRRLAQEKRAGGPTTEAATA